MDPLIGAAAIGAIGNLAGGFMSAQGAAAQAAQQQAQFQQSVRNQQDQYDRSNELNQWYFAKNWENQMYMSNTAYQRAMGDMRAAGLNPILAYRQGGAGGGSGSQSAASGASSPGVPSGVNTGEPLGRGIGAMASSALDAVQTMQQVDNMQQQNRLTESQTLNTTADTNLRIANTYKSYAEAGLTHEQILNQPAYRALLKAQTSAAGAAADLSGASAAYTRQSTQQSEPYGQGKSGQDLYTLERAGQRIRNAIDGQPGSTTNQNPVPSPKRMEPPSWRPPYTPPGKGPLDHWWSK